MVPEKWKSGLSADNLELGRRDFLRLTGGAAALALLPGASTLGRDISPVSSPAPQSSADLPCWWSTEEKPGEADVHVAFRGTLTLAAAAEVDFRLLGASWFVAWLDGERFAEGPARFARNFPEYQTFSARLGAGRHVLAVQVHDDGDTRMLGGVPPFFWCDALAAGQPLSLRWTCLRLGGYAQRLRRINAELGWIEWCDTREIPETWRIPAFDDAVWKPPVVVARPIGAPAPLSSAVTRTTVHRGKLLAEGPWAEIFGYDRDDPPARFFLRDLAPAEVPPQGVWRRYDLGRVRLMRPRFVLDLPAGSVVEFAYTEALLQGRVSPWITLSTSTSCNLDHYVARGGPQEFSPLAPRGGRFVEVHILAPAGQVKWLAEDFLDRGYYGEPEGAFACADPLLNRIWKVGVDTHRACAEDALIDNPTRERGQWAGDVVTVGMHIAGVAYNDLRLCRRGLAQCAQSARADGLVAGMCPGQDLFLSTYAAQWVSACLNYRELTGEREILSELFGAAERNIAAFEAQRTEGGVRDELGWAFVDWGYMRNPGPSDMGVNLHYLAALRDMRRWSEALGLAERAAHYQKLGDAVADLVERYYAGERAAGGEAWTRIGYHRAVLGLRLGFFRGGEEKACVAYIKRHILRCFPNDATAPRLSDPAANNPRLITPYFAHYAMPELIERGEMDFVLQQYRKCWGWALGGDRTTWLEVFDPRWSHCHQWAGCPTWQLSRYALGLRPRFDLGEHHYAFSLAPGSLGGAEGRVPLRGGPEAVRVKWTRTASGVRYRLETPAPIVLHLKSEVVAVAGVFDRELPL